MSGVELSVSWLRKGHGGLPLRAPLAVANRCQSLGPVANQHHLPIVTDPQLLLEQTFPKKNDRVFPRTYSKIFEQSNLDTAPQKKGI